MTRLFLDHPWPVEEVFDPRSDAHEVLMRFDGLVRSTQLAPVPFISPAAFAQTMRRLPFRENGRAAAAVARFADQCRKQTPDAGFAVPITGRPDPVPPFNETWKAALREDIGQGDNWHTPQIVIPAARRTAWPEESVVSIRCLDVADAPTVERLAVPLDSYLGDAATQLAAIAEADPWRCWEWARRPEPGTRIDHPCRLPRPPSLNGLAVHELAEALPEARRVGWNYSERRYFIPPADWRPLEVDRGHWKICPFRRNSVDTPKGVKTGPVDSEDRIWSWDMQERHWDVQIDGGKLDVNHEGRILKRR